MKELLTRMASIANELDLKGFVKEANEITNSMLKLAQASPAAKLFPGVIVQNVLYYVDNMMKLHKIYPSESMRVLGRPQSAFKKYPTNLLYTDREIFEFLTNPKTEVQQTYQQLKLREMANQKPTKAEAQQMAWILNKAAENNMTYDSLMKKLQSGETAQSEKFVNNLSAYLRSRNVFGDEVISPLTVQSFSEYYGIFNPSQGKQEKPLTTVEKGKPRPTQFIQYSAILPNGVQIERQGEDAWRKSIEDGLYDNIDPNKIKFYDENKKLANDQIVPKALIELILKRKKQF